MADKKEAQNKKIQEAQDAISDIANIAGKGIGEIWKVFVRKNIVQGLSVLFAAICLIVATIVIAAGITITVPMAILLIIAIILVVIAINLLGNPAYFAMEDSLEVIKDVTRKKHGDNH